MKNLKPNEQLAVLQLVYQLIVSADGSINAQRDDSEISLALRALGYDKALTMNYIGNALWNEAINFNPFEAFAIVSQLDGEAKQEFKKLLNTIAWSKGNRGNRIDIANQIYNKVGIN